MNVSESLKKDTLKTFKIDNKIDVIPNNVDKNFKKVFIHFDFWYDNDYVNNIKYKFIQETIIKIVYDGPWFWKCALNRIRNRSI